MLLTVGIVFANGMPTSEESGGSGLVTINENTNISLVEETIRYDSESIINPIYSGLHYDYSLNTSYVSSTVKVTYKLKCGIEEEDTIMYFVSPSFEDFNVSVDGVSILDEVELARMPSSIRWIPEDVHLSYENKNTLYNQAAKIPLSFKASENKELTIEYITSSSWDGNSYLINDEYKFDYYLTPAKYWSGDTIVNLELNLQTGLTYESNINLKEVDKNRYTTTLDRIPDKEWVLNLSHSDNRYFKTNNAILQNMIFIIIFVLCYQSYRLIKKEPYRTRHQFIVYTICVVVWYFVNIDIIGYPFGPIFVWAGYLIIGVIIPIRLVISNHNRIRYGM
jgi:hypothetical protein